MAKRIEEKVDKEAEKLRKTAENDRTELRKGLVMLESRREI